ncbi:hypothetical protein [Pseudomonas coleopterorum]|uniref:hypothetical protein n=1 Tax=Pseudomonas coleopterorum TaxID=1605838 RepID=UPI001113C54F|nr:hypothetical protein [Pseudomonas coleopterorum]
MPAKFTNVVIDGANIGISVSHGTEVVFDGGRISAREIGYQEREPVSLFEHIALPKDTPPDALIDALSLLKSKGERSDEEKVNLIKTSKLKDYLQNSSNLSSTISNIIQLSASPSYLSVISWLRSL